MDGGIGGTVDELDGKVLGEMDGIDDDFAVGIDE